MPESAAKRDRIDSQTVPGWYLWDAPQKPVRLYLSFDFIDRLERETIENFRSLTSRGSEIGGILLGTVVPGSPAGISVEDYETIECDYSRGPLYRLSDADLGRFERAMEEHSGGGKTQAVGFFRSHTRKGLALDQEDLQFLEARFRNPHALALLVRPFATRASVGGIFLREQGVFNSEASALEFPFRSAQLTPSKRVAETGPSAPTRAQVVPIATRREIAASSAAEPDLAGPPEPARQVIAPEPPPEVQPAPPAVPEPTRTPVAAKAPAPDRPAAPTSPTANDAAAMMAKEPEPPATESASFKDSEIARHEAQPTDVPTLVVTKPASKVPMLTGLLAAAVLAFVVLFIYPGLLHHRQEGPAITSDSSPLTLRVEHTGTDLLLTWNRESAAIRKASRATLQISDGDRHENYNMDIGQLRTGSIIYSPLGGDVSFQMEVIGQNGAHTATETLRMLRTRPSPMPEDATKAGNSTAGISSPQNSAPPAESSANAEAPAEGPKTSAVPTKRFDASSLAVRLRPAQAADLAEISTPLGGPVTPKVITDNPLPFSSVTAAPAAPPPAPIPNSAPQSADRRPNASVGGQLQPAELVFRREPEYPSAARQLGVKGVVELTATIGSDGRVKAVNIIKGHPVLAKAAQDAVMQWRYRPTMLNGAPTQSETRITLTFLRQ